MCMAIDDYLLITGEGVPVCEAHVQPYIDDPLTPATTDEYAAWLSSHGAPMRCQRCVGVDDDAERDHVVADFLGANRCSWGDRNRDGDQAPLDPFRAFAAYLSHPSHRGDTSVG